MFLMQNSSAKKSATMFKPDTIAISKSGTIGRLGILKDYMCGNRAIINIDVHDAYMKYVFYLLRSQQSYIADLAVGSVQKNLYISILENLEFEFPSMETQREIADILSSVDDKIESNKQINDNLAA